MYGFVMSAEMAFSSLTPENINDLEKQESKTSRIILTCCQQPKLFTSAIITLKIILISSVIIISTLLTLYFSSGFKYVGLSIVIEVVLLTIILLFIGECLPVKIIHNRNTGVLAFTIYPIIFTGKLLRPFYLFLPSNIADIRNLNKANISIEELSEMLDLSTPQSNDANILNGIMRFGDTNVKEIMKSRVDVVAVDVSTNFKDLVNVIIESGYSRLPVYSENFDDIIGILYIKDLLPSIYQHKEEYKWQNMIRPAYYVPENKKINELLYGFQANKTHMAIINDEYGGTYGIVTMEDILEEIVGEIKDESEEEEIHYSKIDDYNYLFDGKVLLNDFFKVVQIKDDLFDKDKGDADTLAGFILNLKGELPGKNEIITYHQFTFKIEAVDDRRIKQIKVTINLENSNENEK
jgi:gliding motility-associated protein GldE